MGHGGGADPTSPLPSICDKNLKRHETLLKDLVEGDKLSKNTLKLRAF